MRKIFTTLKSVVAAAVVASMTLAASCSYDDTALVERVDRVEKDLATLTERVAALEKRLGEEVEALTALINGKVVVTSVEKQGDATKVTLSDGSSFTVYPECTVVDTDTDTNTYISIAEDNGVLYFAVYEMGQFKEWLLVNGEKVPVYDGNDQDDDVCDNPYQPEAPVAPQFKVEGDQIMVSIDGGNTWVASGLSAAAAGAQIFTGVEVNTDNTVTFTLADGSSFSVVVAELIEFNTTRGQLYVKPGETIDITVTINDSVADVNVMNQPLGWKAEVAPKAADENGEGEGDDVDPGMGVMAAGGTEFTLKITAPSQDFIAAGYAEKSGYISVHFNSDNGACKVGKIAVEVAEITLDVDKEGMITITNTWVDKYIKSDWFGEENIEEFNNYYLAIMPLDYYNEDLSQIYNSNWYEFDVPCAAGYIHNFFANVNPEFNTYDKIQYVEGENEKWVFKASVKDIIDEIDYWGSVSYEGESFMVVVVPTNPQEGGVLMLDKAVAAPFRQLNVNVEVAESTWNNVFFNAKLRGAKAYHFNIKNKAELQQEVNNGWYTSEDAYYEDYLNMWTVHGGQFGSHTVTTDVVNQYISLNDLLNYTSTETYNFPLAPNTTYYFALVVEIEGKTEYTVDDIIRFEFTTADLVEAETPIDVDVTLNEEETEYFEIAADVTVPENTAKVYYSWTNEEILEDIKDTVIADGYYEDEFAEGYSFTIYTSTEAENTAKYLTLVVVNEDGTYTLVQREYKSKAVVVKEGVTLAISNVEFLTSGGIANVTLGGIEGQEVASYRAYACTKGAMSYYAMDEAKIAALAYSDDYRIKEYKSNPFTITGTADYKYEAVMGNTYVIAVAVVFADGTVSNVVCEEHEFAKPAPWFIPVRGEWDNKFELYEYNGGDSEYAFWLYDENKNYIEVICKFGPHTGWDYQYSAKYVAIDGTEKVATKVQTQAPSDYECEAGEKHFRVVANFADGTLIEVIASIPAVEVNYLGEGSTYAPGGELEPEPVADSFEYLGRYFDLDDNDETSGGGYMYKVVAGGVEYSLELYWAYANTDGAIKVGTYNYCYNTPDAMYAGWDGFSIISDSYYYGSTLKATADGVTLTLKDADGNLIGEYVYEGVATFGEEPEQPGAGGGEEEQEKVTVELENVSVVYVDNWGSDVEFSFMTSDSKGIVFDLLMEGPTAGTYGRKDLTGNITHAYNGTPITDITFVMTENGDNYDFDTTFTTDNVTYYHFTASYAKSAINIK